MKSSLLRGIAVLLTAVVVLALDLVYMPRAWADEVPPPKSALVISQCSKIVAVVLVDADGVLHPVPPEALNDKVATPLLNSVPEANRIVATVRCNVDT